jgi:undecaprenyl diphosphate synthase
MDGNRRWAERHHKTALEGHTAGYETLIRVMRVIQEQKIPHAIFYAFSTENWKRSQDEVNHLMQLMERGLSEVSQKLKTETQNTNLRVIGERHQLHASLRKKIEEIEAMNSDAPESTLWIALSYGGRAEIVAAANRARAEEGPLTEEQFARYLYTSDMPDPDLIIRTSGEQRISNFLLWQSAYSELFFTDTMWPDFGESEFQAIVEAYAKRQRRRGG